MSCRTVDVCWLRLDTLKPGHLSFCDSLIDEHERERAGRFVFDADRDRFIAAHGLLRLMLSRRFGIAPASWRFGVRSRGKPVVANLPSIEIHFNISHTKGLIACAVTAAGEVGLDVEIVDRLFPALKVAQNFFAQEEVQAVRNASAGCTAETFTTLWVLKEAYVKATGLGLSVPLDSFAFGLNPPALLREDNASFDKDEWSFHVHSPTPEHILALALPWVRAEEIQIRREEIVADGVFSAGPGSC